jgi:uncharacterized iron-regulated membrane protein
MGIRLSWVRKIHSFLGIFFAPLLLMFVLTGWWQTVGAGNQKDDDDGTFALLISKLSRVHTDSYWPPQADDSHSDVWFKALVIALCVALMVSILSGLFLAWKSSKKKWPLVLALALGLLTPAALLCLK